MSTHEFPRHVRLDSVLERIEGPMTDTVSPDTVSSGFTSVDRALGGGFRRPDLVVLGGDVGSGKSALALAISLRCARLGTTVSYISGEMDEDRLMERCLAIESRLSIDDVRRGRLSEPQRSQLRARALGLKAAVPHFRALAGSSFDEMADILRAESDLGLVVIDYLQLVPAPVPRATHEEDALAVVRRLKALSLELNVPTLLVTQLGRDVGTRSDPRPTLDDFGLLGSVKQHADVVLAIYREEMYRRDPGIEGATELIVAKNRNGPTGFVDLYFYKAHMRFEDMLDPSS